MEVVERAEEAVVAAARVEVRAAEARAAAERVAAETEATAGRRR